MERFATLGYISFGSGILPQQCELFLFFPGNLELFCRGVLGFEHESWTIKKAEHRIIDAFELWHWKRFLRVPWTARRSNQSILKEINPEYSLQGLMLKLKLQYFGHRKLKEALGLKHHGLSYSRPKMARRPFPSAPAPGSLLHSTTLSLGFRTPPGFPDCF